MSKSTRNKQKGFVFRLVHSLIIVTLTIIAVILHKEGYFYNSQIKLLPIFVLGGLVFVAYLIIDSTKEDDKGTIKKSPSDNQMTELTTLLSRHAYEIDRIQMQMNKTIQEINDFIVKQKDNIESTRKELVELEQQKKLAKEEVDALNNTPTPAAEYFLRQIEVGEKKNAQRDFKLLIAGVLLGGAASIMLKFFNLG